MENKEDKKELESIIDEINNVAKDLVNVTGITTTVGNEASLDPTLLGVVRSSVAVTNPDPAIGGSCKESDEEIRQNAMAYFGAQNRTVTREDYIMRCYAMPAQFGSVAKAYLVQDYQLENKTVNGQLVPAEIPNPLALNLYTLGYDANKKLTQLNPATKNNLKNK